MRSYQLLFVLKDRRGREDFWEPFVALETTAAEARLSELDRTTGDLHGSIHGSIGSRCIHPIRMYRLIFDLKKGLAAFQPDR